MARYTAYRGDTFSLNLTFTLSGSAYDLTGATIWFTVKSTYSTTGDTDALIQKTTLDGISILDPSGGLAVLVVPAADMDTLPVSRRLFYDVQVVDATGRVYTTETGSITLLQDVTRSVA